MSAVENFPILLSDAEEESSAVPPCFSSEGINVGAMADPDMYTNTEQIAVPLHSPQQSVSSCLDETKHKCRRDPTFPT